MTSRPDGIGIAVEPARVAGRAAVPAVTVGLRVLFCALIVLLGPLAWWQRHGWPVHRTLPPASFLARGGNAYQVLVPGSFFTGRMTDGADDGGASDLHIFDGTTELGPNHTPIGAIESRGGGGFNDWRGSVLMSTSDNGDPRSDGHRYAVGYRAYPSQAAQVTYLTACLVAALLAAEISLSLKLRPWRRPVRWTRAQAQHVISGALLYAAMALLAVLCLEGLGVETEVHPDAVGPFGGQAYIVGLRTPLAPLFVSHGDDAPGGSSSYLTIAEDGRPLGPAHAPQTQIRSEGLGAYSHWDGSVVFSTSDGSDPRDNGRSYRVSYRVFLLPAVGWCGSALGFVAIILRLVGASRPTSRGGSPQPEPFPRRLAAEIAAAGLPFRLNSLLHLGVLALVYAVALLLVYESLIARQADQGGFRINFEYKVF